MPSISDRERSLPPENILPEGSRRKTTSEAPSQGPTKSFHPAAKPRATNTQKQKEKEKAK
jgi:hypothetical protein